VGGSFATEVLPPDYEHTEDVVFALDPLTVLPFLKSGAKQWMLRCVNNKYVLVFIGKNYRQIINVADRGVAK
jgi:hypothetical protein